MGQVHYTQVEAIPEGEPIMMGTFPIAKHSTVILFDSGASHTFINKAFVMKHQLQIEAGEDSFCIQSPGGRIYTKEMVEQVPTDLNGRIFPTNLLVLKN